MVTAPVLTWEEAGPGWSRTQARRELHQEFDLWLEDTRMTHEEFRRQLDELHNEVLVDALTHYRVWLGLFPTEERVATINRYNAFFLPVRRALFGMALIQCAKFFDRNPKSISLTNLLKAAKENPGELVPHLAPGELDRWSEQLAELENVPETLKRIRDQSLAHLDANPDGGEGPSKGGMDRFLEVIQDVFNGLSIANDKRGFHWSRLQSNSERHTSEVLRVLEEDSARG